MMKKTALSLVLAIAMAAAFTACDQPEGSSSQDVSELESTVESQETAEETTATPTTVPTQSDTSESSETESSASETESADVADPPDMSIDEVVAAVFDVAGCETGESGTEEQGVWIPADDEIYFGDYVLDYRIWICPKTYEYEDGSVKEYNYSVFVLEFDTGSECYKDLYVGGPIDVYATAQRADVVACIFVTAINEQYVLYILEYVPDTEIPDYYDYSAPFTDREIQEIYNAFTAL